MQPQFEALYKAMFATEEELILFRKIVKKATSAFSRVEIWDESMKIKIPEAKDGKLLAPELVEYIMQVSQCHNVTTFVE